MGGTSRGLYRHSLDTGRFDGCASPVDQLNILALVRSEDGQIFFAGSDARLWVLDPAGAACRARPLNDGPFAPLTHITALARGRGSSIWAAARGGLFKVDLARAEPGGQLEQALAGLGPVSAIATDSQGDVWIGSSDGETLRCGGR